MAPRKKAADEAANPTPAPDAPGAPALPDNPPEVASAMPAEGVPADSAPALASDEAEEDAHKAALEALAAEDDVEPAAAPVEPSAPPEVVSTIDAAPVLTDEQMEVIRLKREKVALEAEVTALQERIGEIRASAQTEIESLRSQLAGMSHKPPPAPVYAKDPLREAKSFGVLATWLGPGIYGGPYYTVAGVRMPQAVGLTTGYFPAADLLRSPDAFKAT